MTSNPKLDWSAQNPPPDFAARTVTAILRDRSVHHERRGGGRWLLIAAAAAMTIAGGALAFTALPRAERLPAVTDPNAPPPGRVHEALPAVQATADPPKGPARKPPAPPAIAPSRRKEAPPTPSSGPDAGRRLILPRCNCQEAICDCLQEH
jgi:hypothetical protein